MMKVFVTWSGGKESALACYEAREMGLQVSWLVNMITEDRKRSMTHGVASRLLWLQAQAIGVPIAQKQTTWKSYEEDFKGTISGLKRDGISGGVFGDIDLQEHRDWVERVCCDLRVRPHLPLWGRDQMEILKDFVKAGFEATIVATKTELLGSEWLGRRVDRKFIQDISKLKQTITPCGEAGEYHTFVTYGPLFKQRIEITETRIVLKDDRWFLDILEWVAL